MELLAIVGPVDIVRAVAADPRDGERLGVGGDLDRLPAGHQRHRERLVILAEGDGLAVGGDDEVVGELALGVDALVLAREVG